MRLTSLYCCSIGASAVQAYYRPGPLYGSNFGVSGRNASFDYVVIGGGTAGLAMAHRLAEDATKLVAVVEAGGFYEVDYGNISVVPAYGLAYDTASALYTEAFPAVDWGLDTVPQAGLDNQVYHYWRGRTLGGSSALNGQVYQRGTKGSYQLWSDVVNDTSYQWDQFLPYLERSPHYTGPDMSKRPVNASVPALESLNSSGGPLEIGYINWPVPFGSWAKLGFEALGFQVLNDMISGKLIGTQYLTQTIAPDMTRSSSQASFLSAALFSGRQNLIVYPHTLATRIMFDSNLTAVGVAVETSGLPYLLNATSQVILSAGAVQSPQILMLSGIGPSSILQNFSIPVLVDLPGVGQNLQDHVLFDVVYRVNTWGLGRLKDPYYLALATTDYLANRTGQLTNTGFDYVAWEKLPNRTQLSLQAQSDLSQFPSDWPEVEYLAADAAGASATDTRDYASIICGLVAPLSRGNVTIVSNSVHDLPVFSPNWLTDPTDAEVAVSAFKRARAIFATGAVQPVLVGDEFLPGSNVTTDEAILTYIRQSATTIYHASCTCKMGNDTDPMAVLDSSARVRGVQGLRVVDASSFPFLPPGHPVATIYALAEKIAAEIMAEA